MATFKIVDLVARDAKMIHQTADLLQVGFREFAPNDWNTFEEAHEEVMDSLEEGHISRVALNEAGEVIGWIGGFHAYGVVWELHPLVVHPDMQGSGIGRALVEDFEQHAKAGGGLTVMLGTDDETGLTSLSGVDLYPNPAEHIAAIKNYGGHPYEFYQRCGYTIVGVIPDASGFGKPDIIMTKRLT